MPTLCPNPDCRQPVRDGARFCGICRTPIPASGDLPPTPAAGLTGLLPPNSLLGSRYLVVRKLGQGGMAAVYLVGDTHLPGKQYALKEMSDAAVTDPLQKQQAVALFQRESQLLTLLHHRNIPEVVDTFAEGGKHFIVMEYVDGATLEELLRQRGGAPFSEAQVKAWLYQLCDVLHYLHCQDPPVIFRDLKPDNIMVDRTGSVKLIDFGIARFFSPGKRHDTQYIGTAGYAAPEQYGQVQGDARADIYALGATLYRLLTGYDPASTPLALPSLDQFPVSISAPLRQAIERALQYDRDRRWPSVQELAAALSQPVRASVPKAGGPASAGQAGMVVSRPTTRLLLVMAQMPTWQLAALGGGLALLFALAAVLLAPRISLEAAMALPLYLVAGPLAYAASKRRWSAGLAHLVVTGAVWAVASQFVSIGDDLWRFAAGLLLSAVLMEGTLQLRDRRWPVSDQAPWWKDCAWLAGITAAAGSLALGLPSTGGYVWVRPWLPFSAAAVGALGWFLGDLYRQNVLLKQAGASRPARRRR